MTIKISHKNITYTINKEKLIYVLNELHQENIDESKILDLMKKYNLFDEYFLKTINKI
jgi:hypothetical protein